MLPVALSTDAMATAPIAEGGNEFSTLSAAGVPGLALPYELSEKTKTRSPVRWKRSRYDPKGMPDTRKRCASMPLTSVGTSKYCVSSCVGASSKYTRPDLRHTVNKPGCDSAFSLNVSYGAPVTSPAETAAGPGLPTGVIETGIATTPAACAEFGTEATHASAAIHARIALLI